MLKEVSGGVGNEGHQCEQIKGNIKFARKVHLGVISNIGVAKRAAISSLSGDNQADACYYINLQVGMGVKAGREGFNRHSTIIHTN